MIISINCGSWGQVVVIKLVIDFGESVKVTLKGGMGKGVWVGEKVWGLLCISVVVEGACVRDCRELRLQLVQ
jgi:hypothetical protein